MPYLSYNHLTQAVLEQSAKGDVDGAIQHLLEKAPEFPQRFERMTFYYHALILLKAGRLAETLAVLDNAQQYGHWYDVSWIPVDDEDTAPLYEHPEFAEWLAQNEKMTQQAQAESAPELYVLPPVDEDKPSIPLVIALHGNYSNAFETQDLWETVTELDCMLAVPQSSQIDGKNAYVWNDFAVAETELKNHYEALQAEGNFDAKRVILGGFSMGGGFAAWAALNQLIPVKSVFLVAPYIPDVDKLIALMDNPAIKHLKFMILIGQQDTSCLPNAQALYDALKEHGFACRYELRDQYAHTYPNDFDEVLEQAVKFLLK